MNKISFFKKIEDNNNPIVQGVRIFLLVLIIIGISLLFTQNMWVPKVVAFILK